MKNTIIIEIAQVPNSFAGFTKDRSICRQEVKEIGWDIKSRCDETVKFYIQKHYNKDKTWKYYTLYRTLEEGEKFVENIDVLKLKDLKDIHELK